MPEYLVAIILSTILGTMGVVYAKADKAHSRLSDHELKASETYMQKIEVHRLFERLFARLDHFEDQLLKIQNKTDYDRNSWR